MDIDNIADLQDEIENMQRIEEDDWSIKIKEHDDCFSVTVGGNTIYACKEVMLDYFDSDFIKKYLKAV